MSMAFRIIHEPLEAAPQLHSQPINELPNVTEWITPSDWTSAQAAESFERRNPNVRVLSCERLTRTSRMERRCA